jgi:hypothetical protein
MNIKDIAIAYRNSTEAFEKLVSSIPSDQLDTKHPEGWSARQVIHHMADSEAQSYARIRRLIAEPEGTIIQGYDENAWGASAVLGYATLPIDFSVKVFSAVRASSLIMIERLTDADLAKSGMHSESGKFTIENWCRSYTAHPIDHIGQIEKALRGEN